MDEDIIIIKVEERNELGDENNIKKEHDIVSSVTKLKRGPACSEEMDIDNILKAKVIAAVDQSKKKQTSQTKTKTIPRRQSKRCVMFPCTSTNQGYVNVTLKEEKKPIKNEISFLKLETEQCKMESDEDIILIKVEGDDNDNKCSENPKNSAGNENCTKVAKTDENCDDIEGADYHYLDDDEDFKLWKKAVSNKSSKDNVKAVKISECSDRKASTCLQAKADEKRDLNFSFSENDDSQDSEYNISEDNDSDIEVSVKPVRRHMPPHNVIPTYTEQEIKDAIQAVLDGRMTRTQAVKNLKMGFRTFHKKTKEILGATLPRLEKRPDNKPFLRAMAGILRLTNATPFTTRGALLYCAYCGSSRCSPSIPFGTAEGMRAHTRESHPQTSFKSIVSCMLPMKQHEILKLDIADNHCKVCSINLCSWEEIWSHLESVHSINMTPVKTRIVPYILTSTLDNITCALCPETFSKYLELDSHMSQHFPNYICGNCGMKFVSKMRFKAHIAWCQSERQEVCCELCGKTYVSPNSLKNHMISSHKGKKCKFCKKRFYKDANLLKHEKLHKGMSIACELCPLKFEDQSSYKRHLKKEHSNSKIKRFRVLGSDDTLKQKVKHVCKSCNMTFDTDKYYMEHNKSVHGIADVVCSSCGSTFKTMDGLRSHKKRMHLGEGVYFQCEVCQFKFGAKDYLRKHMMRKHFQEYLKMKEAKGSPYVYKPRTKKDEGGTN